MTMDKSLDLSECQVYTSAKQGSQYLQGALLGFLKLVVCVKHVALWPASGSFPETVASVITVVISALYSNIGLGLLMDEKHD